MRRKRNRHFDERMVLILIMSLSERANERVQSGRYRRLKVGVLPTDCFVAQAHSLRKEYNEILQTTARILLRNRSPRQLNAACRILRNRRKVRQSADRCLKQHPGGSGSKAARRSPNFSSEIQATTHPRDPDAPPVNKGSRGTTIAGNTHPRKKLQSFTAAPVRTA